MIASLRESALTISHSCRGPPTQKRYAVMRPGVVTAVCVNLKKRERPLQLEMTLSEGHVKILRWIFSLRCFRIWLWQGSSPRVTFRSSVGCEGGLIVTASSSIIHRFWKTLESDRFYLIHKTTLTVRPVPDSDNNTSQMLRSTHKRHTQFLFTNDVKV